MRRSIFRTSNTIDHGIAMNVLPDNVAQKWLVMVGLHVNNMRIQTNTSGPTIPYPAMDKSVSCQQINFGNPEGSYFSASFLF